MAASATFVFGQMQVHRLGIAGRAHGALSTAWAGVSAEGPWMVSKVALAMFLDGDVKALRAYHTYNI
jgi:hypothetical protein